jgi:AraC-like DNA-binding protein
MGVIQALLLSLVFIQSRSLRLTGFFLLSLSAIELESLLNIGGWLRDIPWLINISPPLILLLGPFCLMQIKTSLQRQAGKRERIFHFLPFILFFLYSFLFYLQPSAYKASVVDLNAGYTPQAFPIDPLDIRGIIIIEGLSIHLFIYAMFSLQLLWKEKSAGKHKVSFRWNMFLGISLLIASVIFFSTGGIINGRIIFQPVLPSYAIDIFCVVLAYGFTFFWVHQSLITAYHKQRYAKSALHPDFIHGKVKWLQHLMEKDKPYRDVNFTLQALARLANMSTHHVSQVINSGLGLSFSDFVNEYRIRDAVDMLSHDHKVEWIGYAVGYKSKSTFFSIFKKRMDKTPTEFKRQISGAT